MNALIYLRSSPKNAYFGPCKSFNQSAGYHWMLTDSAVEQSNLYPKIEANNSRWGGYRSSQQNTVPFGVSGMINYGNTERVKVGGASSTYNYVRVSASNPDDYHFDKSEGAFLNYGSKVNQASEKVFSRIESYGNSGDRITDFAPRVIWTSESSSPNNAFYINGAGELKINIGGVVKTVTIT